MPNRWISLLIVAFWMVMMTWLTFREGWRSISPRPNLQAILAQSAKDGATHWTISQNKEKLGTATTQVTINDKGHYALLQNVQLDRWIGGESIFGEQLTCRLLNKAEVNRSGALQKFDLDVTFGGEKDPWRWKLHAVPEGQELKVTVNGFFLEGEYRVPYDGNSMVMSSLCPLDRMPDIRFGQSWECPMVDPIQTMTSKLIERPAVEVRVLDLPQKLEWGPPGAAVSCYVVEAKQQNMNVRIWVRQRDYLVLKQTATWGASSMELVRDFKEGKKRPEAFGS